MSSSQCLNCVFGWPQQSLTWSPLPSLTLFRPSCSSDEDTFFQSHLTCCLLRVVSKQVFLWRISIQVVMARSALSRSTALHWSSPRIGAWAAAHCPIHDFAGANHPLTWFFIPLPCRWHPAVPVVPPRWTLSLWNDFSPSDHHLQLNFDKMELLVFPGWPIYSSEHWRPNWHLVSRLFEILQSWLMITWLFLTM